MDLYWKGSAVKVPTLKLSDDIKVLGVTRVPLRAPPPTGFGLPWTPDVAAFPAATQREGGKITVQIYLRRKPICVLYNLVSKYNTVSPTDLFCNT